MYPKYANTYVSPNEQHDSLARLVPTVAGLGHEAIATSAEVAEVAAVTAQERPDVALIGLGAGSEQALGSTRSAQAARPGA